MNSRNENKEVAVNVEKFVNKLIDEQVLFTDEVKYIKKKLLEEAEIKNSEVKVSLPDLMEVIKNYAVGHCPPLEPYISDDWCHYFSCEQCWERWVRGEYGK